MNIDIIIVQFGLGVALFFIVNWIGRHSFSIGYMQISLFLQVEESPAFNFIFRILSPVVFIFIISAILYSFGLDRYVENIYLVSIYYLGFRVIFNLLTNRGLLMNWLRQILQWTAIISICYFSYSRIIINKKNILPDFDSLSNELWIIILLFLFQVLNGIRISSDNTKKRKNSYIVSRYKTFYKKYQEDIEELIENKKLQALVYAIMIYEDFNRPKAARLIENAKFLITKKEHSLGIMQVKSTELIDDKKSVQLGIAKILVSYREQVPTIIKKKKIRAEESEKRRKAVFNEIGFMIPKAEEDEISEFSIRDEEVVNGILEDYNPDYDYIYEVRSLHDKILELLKYDKSIKLTAEK
tara:strand:- start:2775 stop:3839 length:1065 start_codon:yes stop_codon:yes gene_type:complete